jgi:serine protease Do
MKHKVHFAKYVVALMLIGAILGTGMPLAAATKSGPVRMIPENFSVLADMVSPAVVHIRVVKSVKGGFGSQQFGQNPFGNDQRFKDFFDRFGGQRQPEYKQPGMGSGFIINKNGLIVTNNHVVDGADEITVVLKDEREFGADVVGRDPQTDIALIKIDAKISLPSVPMGSSEGLRVGEWVAAIGSPFGLEHTVTAGIVSAKGRVIGSGPYDDFIQTDASINPGNSGGPLINMQGEVVGINTMIVAGGQGIGFAIPIDLAKGIISQLEKSGEVTRGWLGVTIQDLKAEVADYYGVKGKSGVLVSDVTPGNPADKAGIQPKDIILEVDGKEVKTSKALTALVANLGVGETVKVKILRDGRQKTFDVEIGRRPLTVAAADRVPEEKEAEFGFRVTDLTPELSRRYGLKDTNGAIVVSVAPNSKADVAGIQQGDLIVEINREDVVSANHFKKLLLKHKNDDNISLLVRKTNGALAVIQLA